MRSYSLIAPAKINLYLEIIGDRSDGYHELAMVLQTIELADKVELRSSSTQAIHIHCDNPHVPVDETNLAYKAARLMSEEFPNAFAQYGGLEITIEKRIPIAAGLAGGSSNAAAVLVGIDLMWHLGLTQPELQVLGAKIGSDIPFCISGGTAIATGRGEQLDYLKSFDSVWAILAKHRNLSIATPWAYNNYRQQFGSTYLNDSEAIRSRTSDIHSGSLVQAIVNGDQKQIGQLLHNDLEKVALPEYPQIQKLKQGFQKAGVLGTMMSGSGPTVFALCETEKEAWRVREEVQKEIPDPNLNFWLTKLSGFGIQVGS
ncbi:MAG: 4-(cytidine 5'-diphospho)-2-C-methyl-D-erythritol kinase [Spirulinaceae cyanobacterium]